MAKKAQGGALAREAELMRKLGLHLSELKEMGLAELRAKHVELFGEEARSKNLDYLRKRLDFGTAYFEQRNRARTIRNLTRRLETLGFAVTLQNLMIESEPLQ